MIVNPALNSERGFLHKTLSYVKVAVMQTTIKLSPVETSSRANLEFRAGDTVRVWFKIQEKGKTRLQAFEGLVLSRKHGSKTTDAMFTVRKVSNGIGVERIFPLYSPLIDRVEIVKKSKVRRSKLYYIRNKAAKEIGRKMKAFVGFLRSEKLEVKPEEMMEEEVEDVKTEDTPEIESSTESTEEVSSESEESTEAPTTEEKEN